MQISLFFKSYWSKIASMARKWMKPFPPNSSDDLWLIFCLNPSFRTVVMDHTKTSYFMDFILHHWYEPRTFNLFFPINTSISWSEGCEFDPLPQQILFLGICKNASKRPTPPCRLGLSYRNIPISERQRWFCMYFENSSKRPPSPCGLGLSII